MRAADSASHRRVFDGGGNDLLVDDLRHAERLDIDHLAVIFQENLLPRADFGAGVDLVPLEHRDVFGTVVHGKRFGRRLEIEQPAALGLRRPFFRVVVAVEHDALVRVVRLDDQLFHVGFEILTLFQPVGKLF